MSPIEFQTPNDSQLKTTLSTYLFPSEDKALPFFLSGCNAPELHHFNDEALDLIAVSVKRSEESARPHSTELVGNIQAYAALIQGADEVVKLVSRFSLQGDGATGPLGAKHIAKWLNACGYRTQKAKAFYISRVDTVLTNKTYAGAAWFNRKDMIAGQIRPREE